MHRHARLISGLLAASVFVALAGCNYVRELKLPLLTQGGKQVDTTPEPESRMYPENLPIGESLDVQVTRDGDAVRLDNRTVQRFENAELWLNHQYGAEIGSVAIGGSEPLSLRSFRNVHGESFPIGGWLTPDLDRSVVSADLVADGKIHKLIVRLEKDWQEQ
jgi:hypothetical protein